jgi:hypothetical protein
MTEGVIVTAEVNREVIEADGEAIVIETPLIGPGGPAGEDGADPTEAIEEHNAESTEVHGIADTSKLVVVSTLAAYQQTAQKDQPNGYAGVGPDGKINVAALPAIAITSRFVVVSQAAQLALTAQEGDVAIRTDQSRTYIHNGGTAGTMADWTELATPTDSIQSVAGKTGVVTLNNNDISGLGTAATKDAGAAGAAGKVLNADDPTTTDARTPTAHTHPQADITGLVAALANLEALLPKTAVLTSKVGPIKEQTNFQDITGLVLPISASPTEHWLIRVYLIVEAANATMDLKLTWGSPGSALVPEGLTGKWGCLASQQTTTSLWGGVATGTTPTGLADPTNGISVGTAEGITGAAFVASFKGGGKAGTLQMRYAQQTSNSGNLSILPGSVIEAVKVAS